jgi:hypothetical protein
MLSTSSNLGYDVLLFVLAYIEVDWHCEDMIIMQAIAEREYVDTSHPVTISVAELPGISFTLPIRHQS